MFGIAKFSRRSLAISLALSAFAFTAATSAFAQTASPKIGVANITEAITSSQEGKKEVEALIKKFTPQQTELKGLSDEVEKLKNELQTSGDKLTKEEQNKRVKTIDAKQRELTRRYQEAQTEFQQAEQEISTRIYKKMSDILDEYANAKGFDVVLDVSSQTPVLWTRKGTDITKDLVAAYDSKYPVSVTASK